MEFIIVVFNMKNYSKLNSYYHMLSHLDEDLPTAVEQKHSVAASHIAGTDSMPFSFPISVRLSPSLMLRSLGTASIHFRGRKYYVQLQNYSIYRN